MNNFPLDYMDDGLGNSDDQIEEGVVSHDGIRHFPDGSTLFGESPANEMPAIQSYQNHHENMAEWLPDSFLREAGHHLKKNIEDDARTQETTNQYIANIIEIMGITPDFGAAGGGVDYQGDPTVHSTALFETTLDYTATIISSILPPNGPASTVILGETSQELEDRAYRLKQFYNNYIENIDEGFEKELRRTVFWSCVVGSIFGKVFIDAILKRPTFRMIKPQDLIVNRDISSHLISSRITQVHYITKDEFELRKFTKEYRDLSIIPTDSSADQGNVIKESLDQISGFDSSFSTSKQNSNEYKIYETHVDYKVPMDDRAADFSFPVAYIVHLDANSGQILRWERNWKENDPLKEKRKFFVNFSLLPSFDGEGYGLIHYAGQQAHAATVILRMMLTAGMYSSFPGGFYQAALRLEDNNIRPAIGEFTKLQTGGMDIDKAILTNNKLYGEPSAALAAMQDKLEDNIRKPSAIINQDVAERLPNAASSPALAILQSYQKVPNFVVQGYHKSMQQLFELFKERFIEWLPNDEEYPFLVPGGSHAIAKKDFQSSIQIITSTDPNLQNSSYRLLRSELILNNARQNPEIHNLREAYKIYYLNMDMSEDEIKKVLPEPQEAPPTIPLDPISENKNLLTNKPVVAGIPQDHDAHITVHSLITADQTQPPEVIAAANAHIQEHKAQKLVVELFTSIGAPIPQDPSQISPEEANQIAQHAAQIAQQKLAEMQANQQGPQPDPAMIQAQAMLHETQVNEMQIKLKADFDNKKLALDEQKLQLDYQKMLSDVSFKEKELDFKIQQGMAETHINDKKVALDTAIKEKDQLFREIETQHQNMMPEQQEPQNI